CQLAAGGNEHRLQAADPPRAHQRQRTHQFAADDPARLALRLNRRRLGELERPPHGSNRPLARQDFSRSGCLFQPRAHIDRIAGDERAALPGPPHYHIAGVHTDPKRQPPAEQLAHPPLHPQRHMQRPLRIILMRGGSPEGRHHRIADELLDRPPCPLDLRRHGIVKPVEHRPDPLRILAPRKLGRPDEIRKQDRRQLPLLSRHTLDSPPAPAEPPAHTPLVSHSARPPTNVDPRDYCHDAHWAVHLVVGYDGSPPTGQSVRPLSAWPVTRRCHWSSSPSRHRLRQFRPESRCTPLRPASRRATSRPTGMTHHTSHTWRPSPTPSTTATQASA